MLCALGLPAPEPGIYEGIPFGDYVQWNAVSNSQLSLLKRSPRHFRDSMANEATANMRLCELYHCSALEPHAFGERYVVQPEFHHDIANTTASGEPSTSKGTKYVKSKEREFAEHHTDKNIVSREWYEQSFALVQQFSENDEARRILNGSGHVELSIVWDEEIELDGGELKTIRCKARLDRVSLTHKIIADVKGSAKLHKFSYSIGEYSYHRQLAHYVRGWEVITGERFEPWILAHETSAPFTVLAGPLGVDELYEGADEREQLLRQLAECRRTDNWPGMANPTAWTMPSFFFSPVTLHGGSNQTLEV
jgi:hypothetical protein